MASSKPPELPAKRRLKLALALILTFACLAAVGFSLWQNGIISLGDEAASHSSTGPGRRRSIKPPEVDFETLYAHIRGNLAYVKEIEAAAIVEFDKKNPKTAPFYQDGLTAVRLFACYAAGGDFYGEGTLHAAELYATAAWEKECCDPLILSICDVFVFGFQGHHSVMLDNARNNRTNTEQLYKTDYPVICKVKAANALLHNFLYISSRKAKLREDLSAEVAKLPEIFNQAMAQYAALVQTAPPDSVLLGTAVMLLDTTDDDATYLPKADQAIETALAEANTPEWIRAVVKGAFLVDWAWAARGSGWASTVTEEGWRLMGERLEQASQVLTEASEKFPSVAQIPEVMLQVELGQGVGRKRMENWFEKATAIDPLLYSAYKRKMYYLQPRWHGTPKDVVDFGMECLRSEKWEAKIPLVLIEGINGMVDQNESIYEDAEVWDLVSTTYSEFLERYPRSVFHRTKFLEWSVKAGQWKTAKDQMELLGDYWDRSALSEAKMEKYKAEVKNANP